MLGFRKSINQVINRLQKTKLPGGAEAEFGSGEALLQITEQKYSNEIKESTSDSSVKLLSTPTQKVAEQDQQTIKPDSDKQGWFHFFTQKNYRKARELLLAEAEKEPDKERVEVLKSIATSMLSHYDFKGAVEEYEKRITEKPTDDGIYFSYSWIYLDKNLPNEAISVLERGISKIKDAEDLILRKAQILEQYQRYDEALAIANESTNLKGKRGSKFYCLIARIYQARNQQNEARAAYIKSFKEDPANLENIREIAQYFYQLKDYQMELFFRKQAVDEDPKNSSDWALLGNCYLSLGLNNLAMNAYDEANKLSEGKQAWIVSNIGNLLNNVGLYSRAIEQMSKSLEIDPSSQYAHERLSYALTNKDKENQKANEILETSKKNIEAQVRSD
jgi:tetratricopeptide (TPR) repeat protein